MGFEVVCVDTEAGSMGVVFKIDLMGIVATKSVDVIACDKSLLRFKLGSVSCVLIRDVTLALKGTLAVAVAGVANSFNSSICLAAVSLSSERVINGNMFFMGTVFFTLNETS